MLEEKKIKSKDLEHRRGEIFLVALSLVLSIFFVALEWDTSLSAREDTPDIEDLIQDIDISKLKKNHDMVAAISHAENEADETNTHLVVAPTVAEQQSTSTKLVVDEGQSETSEAQTEEPKPLTPEMRNDKPEVFQVVEQMPEFPGGSTAFMKWITENMKYPKDAQSRRQQGKVVVSFIIGTDGSVQHLKIEKSRGGSLEREVLRVMRTMPNWTPGLSNGKPCAAMVAVPINFAI